MILPSEISMIDTPMNEDVEFRRLGLPRTRVLSVSVGRSAANLVRVRQFFHGGKLRKGLN